MLMFCNIKNPPRESVRNSVSGKVTRLSGIPESWRVSLFRFLLPAERSVLI